MQATAQLRTFLIADVRGYTSYTQQHGDEAGAALATAFAGLAEGGRGEHDGRLIELRGDEALAVFESARDALRAAVRFSAASTTTPSRAAWASASTPARPCP